MSNVVNPVSEEDLVDQEVRTNEILVSPGFAMIRFTFFLDVLSTQLHFSDDVLPGEKYWGVVITSKFTDTPIVAIAVGHEEHLKAIFEMMKKDPTAMLQVSETTVISEVRTLEDKTKEMLVHQSLAVNNTFMGHAIDNIEFNELNQDQLTELIKVNNSIVKQKYPADEPEQDLDEGNIPQDFAIDKNPAQ